MALSSRPNTLTTLAASLGLAVTLFLGAGAQAQNSPLPELGESATQFLNSQQEEDIGKRFLQELLRQENYLDDPFLRSYLNGLGRSIGESASLRGQQLHFNLLEENQLNAFAVPGGYITFNSGLILTTETESELASVVGHEIAHLSQRHLPRLIAKQQSQQLPTTAAILASILIGGQAGIAGVTMAQANLLSNQLSYSRDFEREADAIGMNLMVDSGFDPKAMASFFDKLQRFNLVSSKDVPEFLRTHPLSYTRVAEAESRQTSLPSVESKSSLDYLLARNRIQALYAGRPEDAIKTLGQDREEPLNANNPLRVDAIDYGLALAMGRLRRYDEALGLISNVAQKHPDNAAIAVAHAEILTRSGDPGAAAALLDEIAERHPTLIWIGYPQIETLLENDDAADAKKVARRHLRHHPDEFRLYRKLSEANVKLGKLAEAHQADAEYLAATGRYKEAVSALRLALRENDGDSDYLAKSIEARVVELEGLRLDTEKREKG